ncbi:MAG: extensin family protein [Pseudomonadota bacterium]
MRSNTRTVRAAPPLTAPPPLPVRNPARSGPPGIAAQTGDALRWSAAEIADALARCMEILATVPAEVEPQPPLAAGRCGTPAPVLLKRIGREPAIELSPPALVTCPVVAALGSWVETTLQPAAHHHLGAPVVRIRVAASYHCRNRNNAAEGKLSEHAFANALDVRAFVGERDALEVADGWMNPAAKPSAPATATAPPTPQGRVASIGPAAFPGADAEAASARDAFLRAVHRGACGPFTTVLGPDADAAHLDHFHLDLARRRNGASYCR